MSQDLADTLKIQENSKRTGNLFKDPIQQIRQIEEYEFDTPTHTFLWYFQKQQQEDIAWSEDDTILVVSDECTYEG